MATPIVEYEVVEFASEEESLAFTTQLQGFILSPEGVPYMNRGRTAPSPGSIRSSIVPPRST